jgi:hypothetical protein
MAAAVCVVQQQQLVLKAIEMHVKDVQVLVRLRCV